MALFDVLGNVSPSSVHETKPTKGKFVREGYFDWENQLYAKTDAVNKNIKEAVGVILPPYADYLQDRVKAIQSGVPFVIPFYLQIANHVMGGKNDKSKVYISCQRELVRANKIGSVYPMLSHDVAALPDSCPICDSCWDIAWPKVKEFENNKHSNEYKSYKEGHKQLCPQQKYVFNFLPIGSSEPVLLECSKTQAEQIINLHYDDKHPDLLWPYPVGQFTCCWLQMKRTDMPDTTTYTVSPVYHNVPHLRNSDNSFNQAGYLQVIAKMKDLREVSKAYAPSEEEIKKALVKRDSILSMTGIAIAEGISQTMAQAITGLTGASVSAPPTIASAFVAPGASMAPGALMAPPVFSQPTATLPPATMALPPVIQVTPSVPPVAPAPAIPAAQTPTMPEPTSVMPLPTLIQTPSAEDAFKNLQALLGN